MAQNTDPFIIAVGKGDNYAPASDVNPVPVKTTTPVNLASGTSTIGKLGANDGVDIGDVTINNTSASPVPVNSIGRATLTPVAKTVTTSAAQLVAANLNRKYLLIQNQDSANAIYFRFGGTATADGSSTRIAAGGNYEAPWYAMDTQAINAISSAGSPAVNVVEG